MQSALHNRFHLPRRPLIRKTLKCVYTVFAGLLIIILFPQNYLKPIGILPIIAGLAYWHYLLLPKWNYVVEVTRERLQIANNSYFWKTLQSLKLGRQGSRRSLHLVFVENRRRYEVTLRDDILGFEQLAHECFWHANDFPELELQSNSGSLSSTAATKTEG